MALDDLKAKIKLILSQVFTAVPGVPAPPMYTLRNPRLIQAKQASLAGRAAHSDLIIAGAGDAELTNEQAILLRMLYAGCTPAMQAKFPSVLLNEVDERTAAVIVHTILAIGHLSKLIELLNTSKKLGLDLRRRIWSAIRDALIHQSFTFSQDDLTVLEEARQAERKRTPRLEYPRERGTC